MASRNRTSQTMTTVARIQYHPLSVPGSIVGILQRAWKHDTKHNTASVHQNAIFYKTSMRLVRTPLLLLPFLFTVPCASSSPTRIGNPGYPFSSHYPTLTSSPPLVALTRIRLPRLYRLSDSVASGSPISAKDGSNIWKPLTP